MFHRIETFYLEYHKIVSETLDYLEPEYGLMIHSFTKNYEALNERDYEIGVLYNKENPFVDMICKKFTEKGRKFRVNEPYSGKDGYSFVLDW